MTSQIEHQEPLKDIEAIIARIDDDTKLLRLREVEGIVGLKTTEIYQRMKTNSFPRPIRLGKRQVRWISDQITEWKKSEVLRALSSRQ